MKGLTVEQEINGKVQKINDEDYEIIKEIESVGTVYAIKWYMENYECGVKEAREAIKTIQNKYHVKHQLYWPDQDELFVYLEQMIGFYNETGETDDLEDFVKWYMEASGCDYNTADVATSGALNNYMKINGLEGKTLYGEPRGSCMITLLLAITSTLSIGSLIAYCI